MKLVALFERAFPVHPVPTGPLVETAYLNPRAQGDEGASAFFLGKPWNTLDAEGLNYHRAAMYMFTPHSHRYYLPAFMLAALREPEVAGSAAEDLMSHLTAHSDPFWQERIRVLTPAQCEAIGKFIQIGTEVLEFQPSEVEAALAGLSVTAGRS